MVCGAAVPKDREDRGNEGERRKEREGGGRREERNGEGERGRERRKLNNRGRGLFHSVYGGLWLPGNGASAGCQPTRKAALWRQRDPVLTQPS